MAAARPDSSPTSAAPPTSHGPKCQPTISPPSSDSHSGWPATASKAPTAAPPTAPSAPSTRPWASTIRRMSRELPPLAATRPSARVWRRAPTANAVPASSTTSSRPSPTMTAASAAARSASPVTTSRRRLVAVGVQVGVAGRERHAAPRERRPQRHAGVVVREVDEVVDRPVRLGQLGGRGGEPLEDRSGRGHHLVALKAEAIVRQPGDREPDALLRRDRRAGAQIAELARPGRGRGAPRPARMAGARRPRAPCRRAADRRDRRPSGSPAGCARRPAAARLAPHGTAVNLVPGGSRAARSTSAGLRSASSGPKPMPYHGPGAKSDGRRETVVTLATASAGPIAWRADRSGDAIVRTTTSTIVAPATGRPTRIATSSERPRLRRTLRRAMRSAGRQRLNGGRPRAAPRPAWRGRSRPPSRRRAGTRRGPPRRRGAPRG